MYLIRMGVPEMISFWDELCKKVKSEKANAEERKLYKKLGKTMRMLSENPAYDRVTLSSMGDEIGRRE